MSLNLVPSLHWALIAEANSGVHLQTNFLTMA